MDLRAGRESTSDVPRRVSEGESGRRKTDQGGVALRSAPTITPEQDAAYMNAVESGDMEMAQRMVDEAARKAGKNLGNGFTVLHSRSGLKSFRQNQNAVLGFRLMPLGHG